MWLFSQKRCYSWWSWSSWVTGRSSPHLVTAMAADSDGKAGEKVQKNLCVDSSLIEALHILHMEELGPMISSSEPVLNECVFHALCICVHMPDKEAILNHNPIRLCEEEVEHHWAAFPPPALDPLVFRHDRDAL